MDEVWEKLKQNIAPLRGRRTARMPDMPKRLHVTAAPRRELRETLDLHGLTLEEAHRAFAHFLTLHRQAGTKQITFITGRGVSGGGAIKHEFEGWLSTPQFKDKIIRFKWLNDGGAVMLHLRRDAK
ncbi:MAG: Smr/MutS family protein [Alphaproteobacteria bacterium]|nr:Smr/MutS family protein [Alphaproteobacteria bacterium]